MLKDELIYSYIEKKPKIKKIAEKSIYSILGIAAIIIYSLILFTYFPISEKKRIILISLNIILFIIIFIKMKNKKKIISIFIITIILVLFGIYTVHRLDKKQSTNNGWEKYSDFPVFGNILTKSVFDPNVIKDSNGEYKMYFSYRKEKSIAVTTSTDGINWKKEKIALKNNENSWWEKEINRGTVQFINEQYYMWYTGQADDKSYIGIATSDDGINFKPETTEPILISEYAYEGKSVMNPYVMYDNDEEIYKMWYAAGETYEPDVIAYATSIDGINWKKSSSNPILKKSESKESLDNFKVGACEVYKLEKNKYLMFYIGYSDINTARIFYATSKNGIDWKKSEKPIISGTKLGFDDNAVYKPTAVYNKEKNEWLLWYNGRLIDREYIGLATCKDCKFD